MNTNLLERILNRRYGSPISTIKGNLIEKRWTKTNPDVYSELYYEPERHEDAAPCLTPLHDIYGDSLGGFFLGSPRSGAHLKVALLCPYYIFGLYIIDDLQMQPEVKQALMYDPDIDYFMDCANVWYYGYKQGELYVYDAEMDELDSLGPVELALESLLDEWEAVVLDKD